jgi:ATP-dependent protease ClpP protease subunit
MEGNEMNLSYRTEINAKFISSLYKKPLDKPDWFEINAESGDEVEILIYDVIGWPFIDANILVTQMNEYKGRPLNFAINSPGGDVSDGIAILNAMKRHDAKVSVRIDSMAASIATVIAMGGEEISAYKNSSFMIHHPWTIGIGNYFMMDEIRDILKQFSGQILDIYTERASIGKREINSLMDGKDKRDGTWMTAKEAKEKGFIDKVIESDSKVKANMNIPIFSGIPDEFRISDSPTIRDAERALREAGLSENRAKAVLAGGWQSNSENQRDVDVSNKESEEMVETMAAARRLIDAIR